MKFFKFCSALQFFQQFHTHDFLPGQQASPKAGWCLSAWLWLPISGRPSFPEYTEPRLPVWDGGVLQRQWDCKPQHLPVDLMSFLFPPVCPGAAGFLPVRAIPNCVFSSPATPARVSNAAVPPGTVSCGDDVSPGRVCSGVLLLLSGLMLGGGPWADCQHGHGVWMSHSRTLPFLSRNNAFLSVICPMFNAPAVWYPF